MRYLTLLLAVAALAAQAQLPPYQRNQFTTNTAGTMEAGGLDIMGGLIFTNEAGVPMLGLLIDEQYQSKIYANTYWVYRYASGQWWNQVSLGSSSGGLLQLYSSVSNVVLMRLGGNSLSIRNATGTETIAISGATGRGTFDSLILRTPQWTDIALDYSYSVLGPNAPSLTASTNGSVIQQLAMDNGDIIYASGHFPHNLAITNSSFPVFYFKPHVHWTPIGTLDDTHSNVTWRLEYEIASTNGLWNVRGTNIVTEGVTNNWTLRSTSLGFVTNTVPPGHDAGIRVRLTRPASSGQEYGNDHIVLFDGIVIQVPVGNQVLLGHP